MPGELNYHRQYTSSNFTPFYLFTPTLTEDKLEEEGDVIHLERSASADKNTILVMPFLEADVKAIKNTPTSGSVTATLYMLHSFQLKNATTEKAERYVNWIKVGESKTINNYEIGKFENLLAAPYKLVIDSATAVINVAFNDEPISTLLPNGRIDFVYGNDKSILPSSVYSEKIVNI